MPISGDHGRQSVPGPHVESTAVMSHRVRSVVGRGALAATVLSASLAAQTVTLNPPGTALTLNPGETRALSVTVCLPGQLKKVDVYVLIDTTPSMLPVIDSVRSNAAELVSTLLATPGVDLKVGIGTYRDFPFDAKPFDHRNSPTYDAASLEATIAGLTCGGGGDGSECQLYALEQLATDGSLGFRPDAKRIVVWFGDSPGHDPICPIFVGFGELKPEITEATATAALQHAGPGGTAVIAISTPTGYELGLNDDPLLFATNYEPFCAPGGLPGQADRIAAATSGISTFIKDPEAITQTILDAVASLLQAVDLTCELGGALAPFVKTINPPSYQGVVIPGSPDETVCRQFDLLLQAPPCRKIGQLFPGDLVVRRNGIPMNTQLLSVSEPACKPLAGLLLAGVTALPQPKKMKSKDVHDTLFIVPMASWRTPLENIPPVTVPNVPALDGFRIYLQGVARYKHAFGKDSLKVSNALALTLGDSGGNQAVGTQSGLRLWMDGVQAPLGSTLHLHCALDP